MSTEAEAGQAGRARHYQWAEMPLEPMKAGIERQFVVGTATMVARILLAKGAHVPRHSHPNEQVTCILSGALRFVFDDYEVTVRPGEVLCIPPHLPHEAFALEDTEDLDIFQPPRTDWMDGSDAYLRG